jgi:SAM-dependent methyltransferase
MRIILFGGYGTLGTELQKLNPDLICPKRSEVDIRYEKEVRYFIKSHRADIVINAAAVIDNRVLETYPERAISTNIIGAANIANVCSESNMRYVYISTDYVYKGDRGNYTETDEILPFNFYAHTKLGGECSAYGVKNHLIIRCSFGKSNFSYPQAFIDKWSSKDYVDVLAPMIYEAALSPLTGVLNLGTERKTLFSHARERNDNVKPVKLADTSYFTPYDTSLNLQKWINFKSEKSIAKPHTHCRICGSDNLTKYLDLGLMPLANNLEATAKAAKAKERYPLQVMFCEDCGLSQLSVVIDPAKMFSHYCYRSSVNKPYVEHCKEMANDLAAKYGLTENSFMVDIAGNDGALLKQFHDVVGLRVLNVDPASNLVAIAEAQGIPSLADFWSIELAKEIILKHGNADLITATNVFAHVQDVHDFINAAKLLLKKDGVLVIECPYLADFINENEYNQTYFEHLSIMSVSPINTLCDKLGMKIISVYKQNIHGGTIRVTIAKHDSIHEVHGSVGEYIDFELRNGFTTFKKYSEWSESINKTIETVSETLINMKRDGKTIVGIGGSAKGNTLLNASGINTDIIDAIIDDTPEKIGKYSPGTGIPIVQRRYLAIHEPDYVLILAENFKDKLMEVAREAGFKGKFILALPKFEIID